MLESTRDARGSSLGFFTAAVDVEVLRRQVDYKFTTTLEKRVPAATRALYIRLETRACKRLCKLSLGRNVRTTSGLRG